MADKSGSPELDSQYLPKISSWEEESGVRELQEVTRLWFSGSSEEAVLKVRGLCEKGGLFLALNELLRPAGFATWSSKRALAGWELSFYGKQQYICCRQHIRSAVLRHVPRWQGKPITILDIGSGLGSMALETLRILRRLEKNVDIERLVLIDSDRSLLDVAEKRCYQYLGEKTSVETYCMKIEDDFLWTALAKRHCEFTLTLCISVLHHLNYDDKINVIRDIKSCSDLMFVGESEGNHDDPVHGSTELTLAVWKFFDGLTTQALGSRMSSEYKLSVLRFLAWEALTILGEDYYGRGNYHCPLSHWLELVGVTADFSRVNRFKENLPPFISITWPY